ncbi:sensor histidine kinase [Actinomadura sp. WMMB 499]|uniref:sensor histidine kinase n=1 Tax=Actinomadura sp. WMMB 499 TaxID=1219491 RepID=UPI001244E399|nr:histidine kinase [Actinomadura sp. WMMB 499]QFG22518.1 sensor histidine kinase [Actinomadura sp. WMMB 499]
MVGRMWEWLRGKTPLVDAFLMAPLALFSLPGVLGGAYGVPVVTYVAVTAGLLLPLVLRRTWPRPVFVAVVLVAGVQCLAGIVPLPANIAVLTVLYTVTAGFTLRWGVAAAVVVEVGAVMATFRYPSGAEDRQITFAMLTVVTAGVWLLGLHMRTRRAYLRSLEERAERLERERDAEVKVAMAAERASIARELHDVVAHNVSVIVVQADGASYAIEHDVGRARQALEAISTTGRYALGEMRRLLGVLREDDDAGAYAPQPGVAELDDLVGQVRASGLPVTFEVDGMPPGLSEGRQLTVFRIVQEALTNTLKHGGPRVSATVRLRYGGDAVEIRVDDDGRGAAASDDGRGHGLVGMRERAAVYGGTVRAAPRAGGGFGVLARIPTGDDE